MELIYILCMIAFVFLIMIIAFFLMAKYGFKEIFPNSGMPDIMGKILLASGYTFFQFMTGLLIIGIVVILIYKQILKTDVGIPIITTIAGYLLGRVFTEARMSNFVKKINDKSV
jgi:hypothetical protein